jgi:hypothetical protein
MEKLTRQSEIIISRGKQKFEGKTTAKNMRSWILGRISKYGKGRTHQDLELRMIFEGVLNAYNHFEPETEIKESLNKEEITEKLKSKKLISEKQFDLLKRLYKDLDMKFDVTMNWKSFQANKKIQELNKIKESYMN